MSAASPLNPLSREESLAVAKAVIDRMTATSGSVSVASNTTASTEFARNEVRGIGGRSRLIIDATVHCDGSTATGYTTRRDPKGLDELVSSLERIARSNVRHGAAARGDTIFGQQRVPQQQLQFTDPPIFFESSVAAGAAGWQSEIVRKMTAITATAGVLGFGQLSAQAESRTAMNTDGRVGYTRNTFSQYSVSARTASGKGSGWAWGGREDASRVDPAAITEKAIDIAKRSDNPVAVEPGRYTAILEPEALAQLIDPIFNNPTQYLNRGPANAGFTVFSRFESKMPAGNKIGRQMADRRVQLYYDPYDKELPFSPLSLSGMISQRGDWIENGVLTHLAPQPPNPVLGNLMVSSPTQTLEEMIANTQRGIWVHRFSSVDLMGELTLLLTGVTRDGTFLIENGKVTKAIKNLRCNESPFFILNKIEAAGAMVRASAGVACPRLKVRDFEFTSLSDAI